MPGGLDSYAAGVIADGPVAWYRFSELAGESQDPSLLCLDSSGAGALSNQVPHGNFLQYGSAVTPNVSSVLNTRGINGASSTASGTYTITGSPTTASNNIYTIAGTAVTCPQTTGNTVTQQAAADILVINANASVNTLVRASNSAGVVTLVAVAFGVSGNGITTVGSSSGGDTLTANQAALSGGSSSAGLIGNNLQNGAVLFPSTATLSTINIVTGGASQPAILQPTALITVEAWHIPNVIGAGATQVIACYGSDASALAAYKIYHSGTSASNHLFAFTVNIAGTARTATAAAPTVVAGTMYHVVGVYTGAAVLIYVNGVLQGTTAITGAISYASIGAFGLAVGNDPSLTDANIQGYVDELAIYASALSATRIAYHYRQGTTVLPFVWRH